jgi:hypothetical protein
MPNIVVSPSEQKRFSDLLEDRTKLLIAKKKQFMDTLDRARAVCQDDKYAAFRKKAEETAHALETFRKNADRYVDFLRRKAAAGERYLKG